MVGSCWGQWRAEGGLCPPPQMWRGEHQERNGLRSGGSRGWGSSCLVLVPVVLCPGLLGAGPADRSWHPDPSRALTPGGTSHSPSMLCTFFLNCFYYYHYFSPCSDGVSTEGEEGSKPEWSCSPSLQGWLQLHGREATLPRSAPSLGHLAENQPVHPSGRRDSFPSFESRDGHVQPGHGPLPYPSLLPSWRRASPTVTRPSCATCLLRQMRWERDGGERAECRGGGATQP